jgi:hypothetical protein
MDDTIAFDNISILLQRTYNLTPSQTAQRSLHALQLQHSEAVKILPCPVSP